MLSRFIIPLNWVPIYRDCAGCHTILTQVRKLLVGLVLLGFAGATPVLAAGEEGTPDPVDIIILVDESASLSSAVLILHVRFPNVILRKLIQLESKI